MGVSWLLQRRCSSRRADVHGAAGLSSDMNVTNNTDAPWSGRRFGAARGRRLAYHPDRMRAAVPEGGQRCLLAAARAPGCRSHFLGSVGGVGGTDLIHSDEQAPRETFGGHLWMDIASVWNSRHVQECPRDDTSIRPLPSRWSTEQSQLASGRRVRPCPARAVPPARWAWPRRQRVAAARAESPHGTAG
eukprot:355774-Chlamydomonas_euryale.AAC.2